MRASAQLVEQALASTILLDDALACCVAPPTTSSYLLSGCGALDVLVQINVSGLRRALFADKNSASNALGICPPKLSGAGAASAGVGGRLERPAGAVSCGSAQGHRGQGGGSAAAGGGSGGCTSVLLFESTGAAPRNGGAENPRHNRK